jgi:pimeloyl-ACP methyl ester carboxylesterase
VSEPTRARYPDAEGFVDAGDGVRVFYEVYGAGTDTICLLAPWPLTHSRSWKAQIPYLSRHFRVIAIDPRGNGRSDRPPHASAYSRAAHVADTLAVLDVTGTERAMLVSPNGPRGPVGLQLAVEHAERVRAVAFITPGLWVTEEFLRVFAAGEKDRYEGWEKFNAHHWMRDYRDFIEYWATVAYPHPHSTRQIENFMAYALETDGETMVASLVGFDMYGREEALELARRIRCPVLVTQNGGGSVGEKETSRPFAEASGGRLLVFEGLGPLVASRWPVVMNLALREFFESVREAERAGPQR